MRVSGLVHRHVPSAAPDAPLLLVLHGRGDSSEGFAWLPGELGDDYGYLFVDAPDPFGPGWSWYPHQPDHEAGIIRSRGLLVRALDELVEQGVPTERIVLFGFSQGSLMAVDVGLRYRARLGAVLGFSGYVAFPDRVASERTPHASDVPWRISHGTQDAILPIDVARSGVAALRAAGIPVTWAEYPDAHTIGEENLVDAATWLEGALEA